MKDRNGKTIEIKDLVLVPEPNDTDIHNFTFVGTVSKILTDTVIVEDGDGDFFEIEGHRLEFYYED